MLITKGELKKLLYLSFAIGDIWMLLAALIFALYSILLRKKPVTLSVSSFQLSTFMLGLIFMLPFFIMETLNTPPIQVESKTVLSILYIGIFASLTAYILWNKAIVKIGATNAGMVYYTLPLFSGFLAYLFLGETIGMNHIYSLLFILSGILVATLKKN